MHFHDMLLNVCLQCFNPDQSHGHSSSLANIRPPSPRHLGLTLSDLSNPILHPPRLTYSSLNNTEGGSNQQQGEHKRRVGSKLSLINISNTESLLFCSCYLHTSYLRLSLISTSRVVIGNPRRCSSTLWTNTGAERGHCIITTTSCVSLVWGM